MTVTITKEKITPEIAQKWLEEANTKNRRLSLPAMRKIARDISNGNWQLTADPIRFNGDEKLIDGQHRLRAIIEAGKAVEAFVARGLDSATKYVIDSGRKRTISDALRFEDFSYATKHATLIRWIWLYEAGVIDARQGDHYPTTQEAVNFALKNRTILESSIRAAWPQNRGIFPFHVVRTPLAAIYYYTSKTLPGEAVSFIEQLHTGVGLTEDSPLLQLRRRLEIEYAKGSQSRHAGTSMHALVIKAWNAYITGDKNARITYHPGGSTNERFPRIITEV